jgi:hypothetical protein
MYGSRWLRCGVVLLISAVPVRVEGVPFGTAFTYQGRVLKDGVPVDGAADFEFTLWDASMMGNLVAGPVSANNVPVSDGSMTYVWDGENRLIEARPARSPATSGWSTPTTT